MTENYFGLENPQNFYYGPDRAVPTVYSGAWQIRQVGVGGVSTIGSIPAINTALANPPANMVTAANAVLTKEVVTQNDKLRYWPAT